MKIPYSNLRYLPDREASFLPDREASLIKKEYCRCGSHPLQVTPSRAGPPLVKGAGLIGPLFPDFRGWPLWFHCTAGTLNTCTVPGASLHSEALSPECGRECPGIGDCEPTRHVGAGLRGLLLVDCLQVARATTTWAHASAPRWGETWVEVSRFPDFWPSWGGRAYSLRPPWQCRGDLGCGV